MISMTKTGCRDDDRGVDIDRRLCRRTRRTRRIIPFACRDQLAALLTDDDAATLKHLAAEARARILSGRSPPTSRPPRGLVLASAQVIAVEIRCPSQWDPVKRAEDPAHGLSRSDCVPTDRRRARPRRRLTSWSILTRWRGLTGAFGAPPLKGAPKAAVKGSNRPRLRKSRRAVTTDILRELLRACAGDRLVDVRDRGPALTAFASGGPVVGVALADGSEAVAAVNNSDVVKQVR
ncbi:integrase [Sinorhizobium medicae]